MTGTARPIHSIAAPLWKATVAIAKSEAADVAAVFELAIPHPQAVLISEDPFTDDATVEGLYAQAPDGELLERLSGRAVQVILLPDQDWIRLSHESLPPVLSG